eukprot:3236413-Pyramimonas_sp.AAC.3
MHRCPRGVRAIRSPERSWHDSILVAAGRPRPVSMATLEPLRLVVVLARMRLLSLGIRGSVALRLSCVHPACDAGRQQHNPADIR